MTTSKHKDNDEKLLWTINETAKYLAVHVKTVARLIDKGELPSLRIGRCIRVPKRAVLDWVEAQTRYNWGCVESVLSHTGESLCDSISETVSTKLPTNQEVENRLDALLTPMTNK